MGPLNETCMVYTLMDIRITLHIPLSKLLFLHTNSNSYFLLTDLVTVERPLELGGASGDAADGDRQHSLHQQRQRA